MPGHEDKMPFGNRPNGIYVPRFRNVKTKQKDFLRGYGYQGGGSREGWSRGIDHGRPRRRFQEHAEQAGPVAHDSCRIRRMPAVPRQLRRDRQRTNWTRGEFPRLRFTATWGENEHAMSRDISVQAGRNARRRRCATDVNVFPGHFPPGLGIHEMGTARMGRDPKTSLCSMNTISRTT